MHPSLKEKYLSYFLSGGGGVSFVSKQVSYRFCYETEGKITSGYEYKTITPNTLWVKHFIIDIIRYCNFNFNPSKQNQNKHYIKVCLNQQIKN